MMAIVICIVCVMCGAGGYYLADWMTRQMIEWHMERMCDPRVHKIVSKWYADDRLRYLCWSVERIKKALKLPAEDVPDGADKPVT